jgi:alpha-methylacyl-CoA racemase
LAGLGDDARAEQWNATKWPAMKARVAEVFATKTRDEWCALLEGTDICFAPVLDIAEAATHAHNRARQTFVTADGVVQPAPAPRFGRTPPDVPASPPQSHDGGDALAAWGFAQEDIVALRDAGALG